MGHYALPMAKEGKGGILVGEEGGGYGLYNLANCSTTGKPVKWN